MKNNCEKLDKIGQSFYSTGGSIDYRSNGKIRLQLCYRDDTGQRRRKGFVAPTLDECYKRANQYAAKYQGFITNIDSTIPEILTAKSESNLALNYIKPQTHAKNLDNIRIIQKHIIGQLPIVSVTPKIIEDFLSSIIDYSRVIIDLTYRNIFIAFDIAAQEKLIPKNPLLSDELRKPKSKKRTKKVEAFTEYEQQLILNDIANFKTPYGRMSYKHQYLIQLYSGLRMGEVNALTPDDIDFPNNVIHVKNTVIKYNNQTKLGYTAKTYSSIRNVPICKALMPVLKKALAEMPPNPHNLIFYDIKRSKIISTEQASAPFRYVCKRCGLKPRGSHVLRHTFATRCIEAGIPAVVLRKWLGHTDIHVTLDTYAAVFDRMNNAAIDKLNLHMEKMLTD